MILEYGFDLVPPCPTLDLTNPSATAPVAIYCEATQQQRRPVRALCDAYHMHHGQSRVETKNTESM